MINKIKEKVQTRIEFLQGEKEKYSRSLKTMDFSTAVQDARAYDLLMVEEEIKVLMPFARVESAGEFKQLADILGGSLATEEIRISNTPFGAGVNLSIRNAKMRAYRLIEIEVAMLSM